MQNRPATYTEPAVIKPYAFPDASVEARPLIPWIDPALTAPPPGHTHRPKFTPEALERLVRIAAEVKPWTKPRGEITKAWNGILQDLQSEGHFTTSSVTTIQNKLKALIAWQEVLLYFLGVCKC